MSDWTKDEWKTQTCETCGFVIDGLCRKNPLQLSLKAIRMVYLSEEQNILVPQNTAKAKPQVMETHYLYGLVYPEVDGAEAPACSLWEPSEE